jgi:hypothetical protein
MGTIAINRIAEQPLSEIPGELVQVPGSVGGWNDTARPTEPPKKTQVPRFPERTPTHG